MFPASRRLHQFSGIGRCGPEGLGRQLRVLGDAAAPRLRGAQRGARPAVVARQVLATFLHPL